MSEPSLAPMRTWLAAPSPPATGREPHAGRDVWVHRKGAMPASRGQAGVLPGSMGSASYHVEGRGLEAALCSSAHGAGRALSRAAATAKVTDREFRRQMQGVWYDYRLSEQLRDEAPAASNVINRISDARAGCSPNGEPAAPFPLLPGLDRPVCLP